MIDKNDILRFAKHVYTRGQGVPDRKLLHPKRDWAIGLSVFLLIVFAGGVLSTNLFEAYKNVQTRKVDVAIQIPVYKELLVKTVLEKYSERSEMYDSLQKKSMVTKLDLKQVDETPTTTDVSIIEQEMIPENGKSTESEDSANSDSGKAEEGTVQLDVS